MTNKTIKICFWIFVIFIGHSFAQQSTGTLTGTIHEFLGAVVSNAKITIRLDSETNQFTRTISSNDKGQFIFSGIPSGKYEIQVETAKGSSFKRKNLWVRAGESVSYTIEFGTDCDDQRGKTLILTDKEKSEIVNQILTETLLKKNLPDYLHLFNQKGPIILSTRNIQSAWVKPLEDFDLKLLNQSEIKEKAAMEGDFLFLAFNEFRSKGDCLLVNFDNDWVFKKDIAPNHSGGGLSYIYRKESDKLVRRLISSWIR